MKQRCERPWCFRAVVAAVRVGSDRGMVTLRLCAVHVAAIADMAREHDVPVYDRRTERPDDAC